MPHKAFFWGSVGLSLKSLCSGYLERGGGGDATVELEADTRICWTRRIDGCIQTVDRISLSSNV